jgi:hypothetical protein
MIGESMKQHKEEVRGVRAKHERSLLDAPRKALHPDTEILEPYLAVDVIHLMMVQYKLGLEEDAQDDPFAE